MLRAALARLTAARPAPPATTRAFASGRSKRGIYAGKDIRFGNNITDYVAGGFNLMDQSNALTCG